MEIQIKFHPQVPNEVQIETREYMYSKAICEQMDGIARPMFPLRQALLKKGFWVLTHIYGFEILPLHIYVEHELKDFPKGKSILLKAMRNNGLSDCDIKKFAPILLD